MEKQRCPKSSLRRVAPDPEARPTPPALFIQGYPGVFTNFVILRPQPQRAAAS